MLKSLDKLKNYLKANKNIEMAFLFGSEATGNTVDESDVDVAVWLADDSVRYADLIWSELETLLHRNVDLIILNSARPAIAWQAMRGIPLMIRDYSFFIRQMLLISDEAEYMQDFTLDLFKMRQKLRSVA